MSDQQHQHLPAPQGSNPTIADNDPWFLFFSDCKRIAAELRAKRAERQATTQSVSALTTSEQVNM